MAATPLGTVCWPTKRKALPATRKRPPPRIAPRLAIAHRPPVRRPGDGVAEQEDRGDVVAVGRKQHRRQGLQADGYRQEGQSPEGCENAEQTDRREPFVHGSGGECGTVSLLDTTPSRENRLSRPWWYGFRATVSRRSASESRPVLLAAPIKRHHFLAGHRDAGLGQRVFRPRPEFPGVPTPSRYGTDHAETVLPWASGIASR